MALFHLISLGCAKNLVDSEVMIGSMLEAGWQFSQRPEDADLLLLNTCGFIQPAVEEAIEEIFELVAIKREDPDKILVVVGCLVQRYQESLRRDLAEVDLFVGTEGAADIASIIEKYQRGYLKKNVVLPDRFLMSSSTPRIITTPIFRAWLKITEGCDNHCSYCMIPSIRGRLRSRPIDDLVREACELENSGVKELSFIAQDTTAYGNDLDADVQVVKLLQEVISKTSIPWLRLLYLYPSGVTDELLQYMAENKRILPYFDIPFQHVNSEVLRSMNRRYSTEYLYRLIDKIRKYLPDVALRTTFLVGFPGETERAFLEIESFLKETKIDHVGVFAYANEEGCPSENFAEQISEKERERRRDHLLSVQAELSAGIQEKYLGRIESVLVEGRSSETDLLLEGRTKFQAPEVDGCVYINEGTASPGDIVKIRITDTQVYDLVGGIVE